MREGPGRALGLDLGERRVGVALSDSARSLATPHSIITRSGDEQRDRARIAKLIEETGATVLVVGLPVGLDGRMGASARGALLEAETLATVLAVPVEMVDERFSTVEAERRRREGEAEADAERRRGRGARRRAGYGSSRSRARVLVDDRAAAVMLQTWLDTRRAMNDGPAGE